MKISNVGIVGYGSIGKKHYKIIKSINKNIKVYFIRVKNKIKITDKKIHQIKIKEISKVKFDCVLICTPANTHLELANIFIKKDIPTFIEKPLTNKYSQIKKFNNLIKYINDKKIIINIGYVLKHGNSYKKFKEIINNNNFGNILDVNSNCNSNLIDWRGSISKSTVSTDKKLGGGVINELSHEIDYINDLFGKITSVYANINKNRLFKINSEESADIIMINNKKIPINLHLDFNSLISQRFCNVRFEKGNIKWDVKKNKITISKNKSKIKSILLKSNNYKNQIKYFFKLIKNNEFQNKQLNEAIEVIKIINLIKESDKKRIELKNK